MNNSLEGFAATEFHKIVSDRQPRQGVKVLNVSWTDSVPKFRVFGKTKKDQQVPYYVVRRSPFDPGAGWNASRLWHLFGSFGFRKPPAAPSRLVVTGIVYELVSRGGK